jgi:hypothetical protein
VVAAAPSVTRSRRRVQAPVVGVTVPAFRDTGAEAMIVSERSPGMPAAKPEEFRRRAVELAWGLLASEPTIWCLS